MRQAKAVCCALSLLAAPAWAVSEEDRLADEIRRYQVDGSQESSVGDMIAAVRKVAEQAPPQTCTEARAERESNYMVTFDAAGKACRVYDLSFPTLGKDRTRVAAVPVHRFALSDYIAWLQGDYQSVYRSLDEMRATTSPDDLTGTWAEELKLAQGLRPGASVLDFSLADLNLGMDFSFPPEKKAELRALLADAKADGYWNALIEHPDTLLGKIRFKWEPVERVYQIFVDFDFLPISGPIAMVDYQVQYKLAVEQILRSVVERALGSLTRLIPEPTARRIVQVALADTFEFVGMMYDYQINRFIDTFEQGLAGRLPTSVARADLEKALNIVYAQRGGLLVQYILSRATGGTLDLENLDKLGRSVRYTENRNRRAMFDTIHSRLVLEKGCEMEIHHDFFGVCNKPSGKKYLYSMLSEQNVLFWNLGAPMLQDYQMRSKVLLKRGTSWLLSAAARVFPLPLPAFLVDQLVSIAKGVAKAGAMDEAYLLNALAMQEKQNGGDEFSHENLPWLYRQNLVPFLPHSAEGEARVVEANAAVINTWFE